MAGLREEIKGLNLFELIPLCEEGFQIPHLRGRITRDIDYATWAEIKKLLKEVFAAAFAGRIDEDRGVARWKLNVCEKVLGGGGNKLCILDSIGKGVSPGPIGG